MEQADEFPFCLALATDLKPYPLILHLKNHFSINVKEINLMLNKEVNNQSFILEDKKGDWKAQVVVLNEKSCMLLKLDKGIDYLIYSWHNNYFKNLKMILKQLKNIKGVFEVNHTMLQSYFPSENQLTIFNSKKIAVN